MNTLNMPGFTAETALYRTSKQYYKSATCTTLVDQRSSSRTVMPQLRRFYVFPGPNGEVCIGFEDFERGISYVAGCF